jgi:Domain of unknown function (DUF1707)
MATERNIRVSDADRDAVAAQLREHYAQGRLTLDELNDRLDRAFSSRTNFELAAVTSDLPYAPARGVLPADRIRQGSYAHGAGGDQRRDQHSGHSWSNAGASGGCAGQWGRGYAASLLGAVMLACTFLCVLVAMAAMGFGLGSGPSIVVIIMGAIAVLRRLLGLGRRTARRRR